MTKISYGSVQLGKDIGKMKYVKQLFSYIIDNVCVYEGMIYVSMPMLCVLKLTYYALQQTF